MDRRSRTRAVNPTPGIRNHNGRCQIDFKDPVTGRRKQILTEHSYTATGLKAATRERNRLLRTGIEEYARVPTFAELAQTYLNSADLRPSSRRSSKSRLSNHWMPIIANEPVDAIRFDKLSQIMAQKNHLSVKTRKNILGEARAVFELARKSGYITENPVTRFGRIKDTKTKIDPFTREERDQILAEMSGNALLFYTIRFYCGLRPGEVIALQWSDWKDGFLHVEKEIVEGIRIPSTKTHVARTVRVHTAVERLLRERRGIGPMFVNQYGNEYQRPDTFAETFNKVRNRLGIRYRSPYNVRHTCACMMLSAGMRPGYCAKQLGHSLEQFFSDYADWIDTDESEAQHQIWETFA